MNQFLEYAARHPYLLSAAVLLAILAGSLEIWHRRRGGLAISPAEAVELMNKAGALVLDVRDLKEYEAGHIINARSIPAAELQGKVDTFKKFRDKPVVMYCDTGTASTDAARMLRTQGFSKVVTLRGGLHSWSQENLPLVKSNPVKRKDGKAA